jgi:subtilisin family serine protease
MGAPPHETDGSSVTFTSRKVVCVSARTRRAAVAVVAAATAVTTAWGTAAQAQSPSHSVKNLTPTKLHTSDWKGKVPGLSSAPTGRAAYFVQLSGEGAVDAGKVSGRTVPGKVLDRRSVITGNADRAFASARGADPRAAKLYTTTNLIPGFAVNTDAAGVQALASRPDVVKVSRIVPKTATNANTANLVHALNTWKFSGDTGKGVRIGVIDTGLDYTHADFGGPGTPAAYDAALAADTAPNWRSQLPQLGKDKVLGGFDLAGDDYNADPTSPDYQPIPQPDQNPLDCNEHGTHVAGIAAGYGVGKGGKTFTGSYANLDADKLLQMRIGPGMAPEAQLYSLRVFGCAGSTDLVLEALDRAMDPNGDGNTKDHFDLINLSVGSDDGVVDDPENAVVAALAAHGVLPVISMGNGGDNTDIGGAPGNAQASLAVASSVDSFQMRDGLEVNAPADVAGISAGQFSVAYDWANNGPSGQPVTGDVVKIPTTGAFDQPGATNNTDGCAALSVDEAAAVTGKVAWLYWDDNDATRRCGSVARSANVAAAGATGAIFTSSLDVFAAGITGSATIPVIQLPKAQTDRLTPAVDAGTLNVTFDGANQATVKDITPAINDTLSSFSSRGTHGSLGVVKPDVTAPGDTIASAGMGTGNNVLVISGTSMASPLVAGVSALVKSKHPDWSPLWLKAAVMNTAGHDVWTGVGHTGDRYAPARVGSGRVDARAAVSTKSIAYTQGADQPVSASFGVVEAPVDEDSVTRSKTIVVRNLGNRPTKYKLSYDAVNPGTGVTYSISPKTLTVGAHKKGTATLTMKVVPTALTHRIDPTMQSAQSTAFGDIGRQFVADSSGHLLVTPTGKGALRVPVYGAAKPVSETKASADGGTITFDGAGVNQGTSLADAYASTASIMQLGDESLQQPKCTATIRSHCWTNQSDRSGDIRHVGAGTGTIFGDHMVWFGISTWRDWATNNTMTPYVDIDVDGDGRPDLETFAQNFASAQGRTDVFLVETVDLVTGDLLDVQAVNLFSDQLDTNVFDTNTILLPVDLDQVLANGGPDLTGADTPVTYWGATHNGYTGADQDRTDPIDYNIGTPDLREASGLGLLDDQDGASYTIEGSGKALVFHLYGESGERDEVVDVAPPAPPAG